MAAAHHYRILGLRTGANFESVKLAYRNLARLYHPDVNLGDHLAKEKFVQITQAYQAIANALPAGTSKVSPRPDHATPVASPSRVARSQAVEAPPSRPVGDGPTVPTSVVPPPPSPGRDSPAAPPSPSRDMDVAQDLKQSSFNQLQVLFRAQRYPRAVALVEGLAYRFPNDPEIRQWHAITYYRWGQMAIRDGNAAKALACLKKAARLDPLNRSLQQSLQQEWPRLADLNQRPTVGIHR